MNFLSTSFVDLLRQFVGRDVVVHNEFSANRIVRVVSSIGGTSIRDRICVAAHDVEVKDWTYHENVLMGLLDSVIANQDTVHLTVEAITIVIKFAEMSSVKLTALSVRI